MPFVIVNFLMIALVDFHDYVNVFLATRQVESHGLDDSSAPLAQ